MGRALVLEGDWPIGLHKVALKAPKLPSQEQVYTEKKKDTQKVYLLKRVRGMTCTWLPLYAHAYWRGGFSHPPPLFRTPPPP